MLASKAYPERGTKDREKVSVVSRPGTDRVSSSEAVDHGLCELDGGRHPSNLVTVNTNQRQTFMRISCFNVVIKPVLNWANICSPEHASDTSTNYDSFLN